VPSRCSRCYVSEHHGYGKDEVESGDYAEDLAATMLASTLGIDPSTWLIGLSAGHHRERDLAGMQRGDARVLLQLDTPWRQYRRDSHEVLLFDVRITQRSSNAVSCSLWTPMPRVRKNALGIAGNIGAAFAF
jgi:hypothetical protein